MVQEGVCLERVARDSDVRSGLKEETTKSANKILGVIGESVVVVEKGGRNV